MKKEVTETTETEKKKAKRKTRLIRKDIDATIKRTKHTAIEVYSIVTNANADALIEILKNKSLPYGLKRAIDFIVSEDSNKLEVIRLYFECLNKLEYLEQNKEYMRLRNKIMQAQIDKLEGNDGEQLPTNIGFYI